MEQKEEAAWRRSTNSGSVPATSALSMAAFFIEKNAASGGSDKIYVVAVNMNW